VLVLAGSAAVCLGDGEVEARSVVGEAEQRVNACYAAAAEAQKAGANVTDLLSTLTDAGMLLAKAELSLRGGDYGSAVNLADDSIAELAGFEDLASTVKDTAIRAKSLDFTFNIVYPLIEATVIVVLASAIWLFFKNVKINVAW